MKFIDSVKIYLRSGNGGNGCVSFRRERGIPKGGPDGGDGGDGGNIVFRGDSNLQTLLDLSFRQHHIAGHGSAGGSQHKHGKNADDLVIHVPCGSEIRDVETGECYLEILDTQDYVFLKGGKGGKGNARFKSSVRRSPDFAHTGVEGVEMWVRLELKLIADVGLVGLPNAGKSTLIRQISRAKPKIADYPFTTLVPNLGVVQVPDSYQSFVMADIPGLIQNAHQGAGLGDRFLRHIERAACLLFVIDYSPNAEYCPNDALKILMNELQLFAPQLAKKPYLITFNKMDLIHEDQLLPIQESFANNDVFFISGATGEGTDRLIYALWQMIQDQESSKN